jgi:hypothetical protein
MGYHLKVPFSLEAYPGDNKNALAELNGVHPEIQRYAIRNAIEVLVTLSTLPSHMIDDRNRDAVKEARRAVRAAYDFAALE